MKRSDVHCTTESGECTRFAPCVELSNGATLCELLPICGCGDPDGAMATYMRVLGHCDPAGWRLLDMRTELHELVLNVLDDRKLIEHGSSLACSWRTKLGDEVLAAMHEHWTRLVADPRRTGLTPWRPHDPVADRPIECSEIYVEFDSGDGGGFGPRRFLSVTKNGKTYMIDASNRDWVIDWVRRHG